MQIMPATGAQIASELQHPAPDQYGLLAADTNIRYGVYYLRQALDGLQGNALLATAAYNAGPSRCGSGCPTRAIWRPISGRKPYPTWRRANTCSGSWSTPPFTPGAWAVIIALSVHG